MRIFVVDAFTDQRFSGNPAAVCLQSEDRPDAWLQAVAAEMNLSETAFVRPEGEGFSLRWFTPTVEVDLCGHATLATAYTLWREGEGREELSFHTRSGRLTARRRGETIDLSFPAIGARARDIPPGLGAALGVAPLAVFESASDRWVAELASPREVAGIVPDVTAIGALPVGGVIVTASDEGEFDFVSRVFLPRSGIDEDPVTGAAHCVLGPLWAARLGRSRLRAFQASRRGGVVGLEVIGERVVLSGEAVMTVSAELVGE